MKNLGNIIIFLILFANILNASVTASVDSQTVVRGEMVTLSLKLDGADIETPNIQTICGEDVISTNSQTSIEMINGNFRKNYVLSYKFLPQKSCDIEPIGVNIGGKTEYTKKISINVEAQKVTKDSPFILTLESSKDEVYVGESFEVTLLFKQKNNATAVDSEFVPPKLQGFWIKSESKPERFKDKQYTTTKVVYTMAAQREGVLKISEAKMKIASRSHTTDNWGSWVPQIKWKTFFSNNLEIKVKKLPSGVDLVGDFSITATVDKTSIDPNEAVNLSIEVAGHGNLEDIKTLKPNISGVSIFDEKVEINADKLTQKIAFVSDKDFVIPSITLRYFDSKTKEIKTISTKEYKIDVKGSLNKSETLNIKRQESPQNDKQMSQSSNGSISLVWGIIIFIFGL
ncbi:MAG: BatD family protein, partial [Thiovulaceae bacterium]|nr:BatD family protein [Sulfurimonadaceae bacterium]